MSNTRYSAERAAGREHVPNYPKGFIAIRIVQLILAVVILGLCAYSLTVLAFSGNCLTIFTAVATIIFGVYAIVTEFGKPEGYNYWAVLSLDIFLVVFWIASFALLAAQIAPFIENGITVCGVYTCDTYELYGDYLTFAAGLAAASGLGGVEFILFIVSLALHSVAMHRHRSAGLHCNPLSNGAGHHNSSPAYTGPPAGGPAPLGMNNIEKPGVNPTHTAVPQHMQQQPATGYAQSHGTPTPPPQQAYQPPVDQPTPYYPQQQQQQQQQIPSPLSSQHTGPGFVQPHQQQQQPQYQHQVPAPHPGSYEAHGQSVGTYVQ